MWIRAITGVPAAFRSGDVTPVTCPRRADILRQASAIKMRPCAIGELQSRAPANEPKHAGSQTPEKSGVHFLKGYFVKKFAKAVIVIAVAAAANVAMADNPVYPSGDSELAGSPATEARSEDSMMQGNAVPADAAELAGFDAIPTGTTRSYADLHAQDSRTYGKTAFPEEDSELAGTDSNYTAPQSYARWHRSHPVERSLPSIPSGDSELAGPQS